jgi:hypothetical protein
VPPPIPRPGGVNASADHRLPLPRHLADAPEARPARRCRLRRRRLLPGRLGSTIKWIKDAGGDASVEFDLYGGYKGSLAKDLAFDVGVLQYIYPSNRLAPSANTTEGYGALTFGPATLKYSQLQQLTPSAIADSKNSYYLDLSASFDLGGGLMLTPHIGRQKIKGPGSASLHRLRADAPRTSAAC